MSQPRIEPQSVVVAVESYVTNHAPWWQRDEVRTLAIEQLERCLALLRNDGQQRKPAT